MSKVVYSPHDELKQCFADRIKGRLDALGMTRAALAMRSGVSISTIDYYTNHKSMPTGYNIVRIAAALQCSTDYLLGVTDEFNPTVDQPSAARAVEASKLLAAHAHEAHKYATQLQLIAKSLEGGMK